MSWFVTSLVIATARSYYPLDEQPIRVPEVSGSGRTRPTWSGKERVYAA